jgi:hypothetical protein
MPSQKTGIIVTQNMRFKASETLQEARLGPFAGVYMAKSDRGLSDPRRPRYNYA